MKKWTSVQVTVEGHCDSRGSAEYNLGARHPPRRRGEGLPGEPRRPCRPRHGRQQGQGTAVLQRRERVLLAAEPPRTFRRSRASRQERQVRQDERREDAFLPLPPIPPYLARPQHPRQLLVRHAVFRRLLPSTSSTGISRPYRASRSGSVEMSISSTVIGASPRATRAGPPPSSRRTGDSRGANTG